jgi:hypothetical protein
MPQRLRHTEQQTSWPDSCFALAKTAEPGLGSCLAQCLRGPAPAAADVAGPQPMRGETERAYRMVALRTASLGCRRPRSEIKSAKIGISVILSGQP